MIALTDAERARAWRAAYRAAVDALPDLEVAWERDAWRAFGAPTPAGICDELLRERAGHGLDVPGESTIPGLDALWGRVDRRQAIARVQAQAVSLVDALRLGFWLDRAGGRVA